MKLQLLSDLHLESCAFTLKVHPEADAIVLAGDVAAPSSFGRFHALLKQTKNLPVFYVFGNHEFYNTTMNASFDNVRKWLGEFENFHILNNDYVIMKGFLIVGGTLWTDFRIAKDVVKAKQDAARGINDFHCIGAGEKLFTVEDAVTLNYDTRGAIHRATAYAKERGMKTIVITHFLPSERSIDAQFAKSPLNPYFASNCEELMGPDVPLWLHGHTHSSQDYVCNGTRVVCNPRGYHGVENRKFSSTLLLEV